MYLISAHLANHNSQFFTCTLLPVYYLTHRLKSVGAKKAVKSWNLWQMDENVLSIISCLHKLRHEAFFLLHCSNSSDIKCSFRCSNVSPNPCTLQTLVSWVQFHFWSKSCDVFYGLKIMLSQPRLDSLIVALWAAMSNPPVKLIRLSHHFYTFKEWRNLFQSVFSFKWSQSSSPHLLTHPVTLFTWLPAY